MLVLTRKQNEKIQIGQGITITVLRMKGKAVRLGIEAPNDVSVLRGEIAFELPEKTGTSQRRSPALDCGCATSEVTQLTSDQMQCDSLTAGEDPSARGTTEFREIAGAI